MVLWRLPLSLYGSRRKCRFIFTFHHTVTLNYIKQTLIYNIIIDSRWFIRSGHTLLLIVKACITWTNTTSYSTAAIIKE